MNSEVRVVFRSVVLAAISAAALSSCSGLSDVGEQENKVPTAIAEVVGYAGADANGDATANVRALSEVLLTGGNSEELDKPIVSFLWEATNAAASAAKLTVRNNATVAVSVPAVTAATDMQFRLTVTDSDGDKDTANVTLKVQPVLDANTFLTYLGNAGRLRVVAGTAQPSAAATFQLQTQARVTYQTRSGASNTITYNVGNPFNGGWLASPTTAPDGATAQQRASDVRNPLVQFVIPGIDQDEITRRFQSTLPQSASSLADPAFIDEAKMELILTLTPGPGAADATLYVVDATGTIFASQSNGGGGGPATLTLTDEQVEALRLAGGGLENRDTAASYYASIDPDNRKLTLNRWLTENCFNPAVQGYGADAHAVYVNDYDLGFGRDMYFRTSRPASCASSTMANGDSAAVVINYPTLEGAAKRVAPIIAVAMEYKAVDPIRSAPGLVTFYVFAPDEGTGEMRRVRSANFDGRGEKYVPGACTACHGGRPTTPAPNPLETYAASADVGATFMPWDLESFLYSDTDPAFPRDSSNAALRSSLTRSAQEAELKKLNVAAYHTYGSIGANSQFQCYTAPGADFTPPCSLVELWYGGAGLPSTTFQNRKIPAGWTRGGGPNNDRPASAETIYLDVFARNCRACHTQRVLEVDPTTPRDPLFTDYELFRREDELIKTHVFEQGNMPLARLTADRLWTTLGSGEAAGTILARHLGLDPAAARPGSSIAILGISQQEAGSSEFVPLVKGANGYIAARNRPLKLDGSASVFPTAFSFSTPIKPEGSTAAIVGANNPVAQFTPDRPSTYQIVLNVGGTGPRNQETVNVTVTNAAPTITIESYSVMQGALLQRTAATGLLKNASDPDGDQPFVSLDQTDPTCTPQYASELAVNIDGSFSYKHNGTPVAPGQTDSFKITVSDGFEGGALSLCVPIALSSVDDEIDPTEPTAVSATPLASTTGSAAEFPVSITWSASTDVDQFGNPGTVRYRIERATGLAGGFGFRANVMSTAELPYRDTGNPNTLYRYRIVAIDGFGNEAMSEEVTATTHSSFRQNINSLLDTPIIPSLSACTTCHGSTQAPAFVTQAEVPNNDREAQFTTNRSIMATYRTPAINIPCYPARLCSRPSGTPTMHASPVLLGTDPGAAGTEDDKARYRAYQNILKWMNEGARDN